MQIPPSPWEPAAGGSTLPTPAGWRVCKWLLELPSRTSQRQAWSEAEFIYRLCRAHEWLWAPSAILVPIATCGSSEEKNKKKETDSGFFFLFFFFKKAPSWPGDNSVQSLSRVQLFVALWTAACQSSLPIMNSRSLLRLQSTKSVMLVTVISQALPPGSGHSLEDSLPGSICQRMSSEKQPQHTGQGGGG